MIKNFIEIIAAILAEKPVEYRQESEGGWLPWNHGLCTPLDRWGQTWEWRIVKNQITIGGTTVEGPVADGKWPIAVQIGTLSQGYAATALRFNSPEARSGFFGALKTLQEDAA